MTAIFTRWMHQAKRQQAEQQAGPWQDYIDLLNRSIDDAEAVDPLEAAAVLEAVRELVDGDLETKFAEHQQIIRKRRDAARLLLDAEQAKHQGRELEARIAKLEAQWEKVTAPLRLQLQQARAEREAAGQRQLFEITATRTLVETWQQIASPADRQAEADLNRQLRDLGERWRAVENDLNPARPGSHAAELSSHQSRLRQPERDRHPSDVANDRGAIERLEPFIERLRQHHAQLTAEMDQIHTKLEYLRQAKLTP
jgi:hypothetical protein